MEKTDVLAIWSNMRYKEKELWLKRKFLMGLCELNFYDKKVKSCSERCEDLQESFLRKDDLFYEDLKKIIEKGFGAVNADADQDTIHGDDVCFRNLHHMSTVVLGLLDDLSNNGLYSLAKILSEENSVIHDKTRPQLRRSVKENLAILQTKQSRSDQGRRILGEVFKLVRNQENFHQIHVKHFEVRLKSHHGAIMKILDGLRDMSIQTLIAIHRKLKGVSGYVPQLCPPKSGWCKGRLSKRVRTLCLEMIGQLNNSDKLQEPLAKAMAIAGLSYKLASGFRDLSSVKFVYVTPQLEALQNEIFKAIQSFSRRIKPKDLKKLQLVLDPISEMGGDIPANAIKNLLVEFLYECSDMDTIPDYLAEMLSIINHTSIDRHRFLSRNPIGDEVECVLNVGANIKQILWDNVPDDNLDEDFALAYMEDLEESDDGDFFNDDDDDDDDHDNDHRLELLHTDNVNGFRVRLNLNDFEEEVHSTGDPDPDPQPDPECSYYYSKPSSLFGSPTHFDDNDDVCMNTSTSIGEMPWEIREVTETKYLTKTDNGNRYVALQEVSDRASLVAYQIIGRMMDEFGRIGEIGLCRKGERSRREQSRKQPTAELIGKNTCDVLLTAVNEVLPSFSSSELEKVKKFMST